MKGRSSVLSEVWERFPHVFSSDRSAADITELVKNISEMLAVGDYYFYVIDLDSHVISGHHPNMLRIHDLDQYPCYLEELISLIHPDDLDFVVQAEDACMTKIWQMGIAHLHCLKSSYSLRMRTSLGYYRLFHHQAIPLQVDHKNHLIRTLNIHSDISHIAKENNYHAYVTGIFGRTDFYDLDVFGHQQSNCQGIKLTKRELDIVRCVAKGMSSEIMAAHLKISLHTVRVHRKNILAKLGINNSVALVQYCSDMGYL